MSRDLSLPGAKRAHFFFVVSVVTLVCPAFGTDFHSFWEHTPEGIQLAPLVASLISLLPPTGLSARPDLDYFHTTAVPLVFGVIRKKCQKWSRAIIDS